jgi:integrase
MPTPKKHTPKQKKRIGKVPKERGLYRDKVSGTYLVRDQRDGDVLNSLETKILREAQKRRDLFFSGAFFERFGITTFDPSKPQASVGEILQSFREAGFPDRRSRPRQEGVYLRAQQDHYDTLCRSALAAKTPAQLNSFEIQRYHAWRLANIARGEGHRTTDLELITLRGALRWAMKVGLIPSAALLQWDRFYDPQSAVHCRDRAPKDADELHSVAGFLFKRRRTESIGWQMLIEALTGLRENEALAMRVDADHDEPGGITPDGKSLCVRRSKKSSRVNLYVRVHPALADLIQAHRAWHKRRYPRSKWFFPGLRSEGKKPVSKGALTASLRRLFKASQRKKRPQGIPKFKKRFTSHGMRAFYVYIRRSQGISDAQIAWEINHVGGVATLETVYAGVPAHWRTGEAPNFSWAPTGEPAWEKIIY